ncbi:GAG-pre-integrase domain [Forsythia ovata]|uniref:GAG-pre-integrase domain n=1 Tax=Forsythia ovata TaxID=205694 RepID=A0ABD1WLD3_9LAMI
MDQLLKKVLLQGILDRGLYKLLATPSTSSSSIFVTSSLSSQSPPAQVHLTRINSASVWHSRLGHPSSKIVHSILSVITDYLHLIRLEPQIHDFYINLSDVFAKAGRVDYLKRIRTLMKDKRDKEVSSGTQHD